VERPARAVHKRVTTPTPTPLTDPLATLRDGPAAAVRRPAVLQGPQPAGAALRAIPLEPAGGQHARGRRGGPGGGDHVCAGVEGPHQRHHLRAAVIQLQLQAGGAVHHQHVGKLDLIEQRL